MHMYVCINFCIPFVASHKILAPFTLIHSLHEVGIKIGDLKTMMSTSSNSEANKNT